MKGFLLLVGLALAGCTADKASPDETGTVHTRTDHESPAVDHGRVGVQAPAAATYPNPDITPGLVDPDCTAKDICDPGYTARVRNVKESTKKAVFQLYHIEKDFENYEVDHFVPLELCGANDVKNLWPQRYEPHPGARDKDVLETALHHQVCNETKTLKQAQAAILVDWYKAYLELKAGKAK